MGRTRYRDETRQHDRQKLYRTPSCIWYADPTCRRSYLSIVGSNVKIPCDPSGPVTPPAVCPTCVNIGTDPPPNGGSGCWPQSAFSRLRKLNTSSCTVNACPR